jgi:hypothetical protein
MDLEQIEGRLKSGVPLGDADRQHLRDLIKIGPATKADRATDLLYAYPTETSVTVQDRCLLERVADQAYSTHTRALALSLLCNWLSLAREQTGRILAAIADRTDAGDFLCIKACSSAALVLGEIMEPRLARALVEVFHDATRPEGTRQTARNALLRIDGMIAREIVAAESSNPRPLEVRAEAAASRLLLAVSESAPKPDATT